MLSYNYSTMYYFLHWMGGWKLDNDNALYMQVITESYIEKCYFENILFVILLFVIEFARCQNDEN